MLCCIFVVYCVFFLNTVLGTFCFSYFSSVSRLFSCYNYRNKINYNLRAFTELCKLDLFLRTDFCYCASLTIVKTISMVCCWVKSLETVAQEWVLGALGLFSESTHSLQATM